MDDAQSSSWRPRSPEAERNISNKMVNKTEMRTIHYCSIHFLQPVSSLSFRNTLEMTSQDYSSQLTDKRGPHQALPADKPPTSQKAADSPRRVKTTLWEPNVQFVWFTKRSGRSCNMWRLPHINYILMGSHMSCSSKCKWARFSVVTAQLAVPDVHPLPRGTAAPTEPPLRAVNPPLPSLTAHASHNGCTWSPRPVATVTIS